MRTILATLAFILFPSVPAYADASVSFLDVDQGDAIWIQDDRALDVLVCGAPASERCVLQLP